MGEEFGRYLDYTVVINVAYNVYLFLKVLKSQTIYQSVHIRRASHILLSWPTHKSYLFYGRSFAPTASYNRYSLRDLTFQIDIVSDLNRTDPWFLTDVSVQARNASDFRVDNFSYRLLYADETCLLAMTTALLKDTESVRVKFGNIYIKQT